MKAPRSNKPGVHASVGESLKTSCPREVVLHTHVRHYASKERKGVKDENEIWKFIHSTFEFSGSIGSVPAGALVICRRGGKDEMFGVYGDGTFSVKDKELKVVEVSEKTIVSDFSGLVVPKPAQRPAFSDSTDSKTSSSETTAKDTTAKVASKRSVSAEADEENKDGGKPQNKSESKQPESKSSVSKVSNVSSVPVAGRRGEFCEKRKCEFSVSYDVCEETDTPASAFNPSLTVSRGAPDGGCVGVGFIRDFGGAIIVGSEGYVQQFVNVSFEHQKTVLFVNFDKQKLSFYDSEYFKRYSVYGYVDLKKI